MALFMRENFCLRQSNYRFSRYIFAKTFSYVAALDHNEMIPVEHFFEQILRLKNTEQFCDLYSILETACSKGFSVVAECDARKCLRLHTVLTVAKW